MAAKRTGGWTNWLGYLLVGVGAVLGVTLAGLVAVVAFGSRHGTEICLETLERRSYSYYEAPLLGIQLTGAKYLELPDPLAELFLSEGFFVEPPAQKKSWRLVESYFSAAEGPETDAKILTRYLDAHDASHEQPWLAWSKQNLPLAHTLWNAVAALARRDLYLHIPELMDLSHGGGTTAEREQRIQAFLAARLTEAAATESDAQTAAQLREEAEQWKLGKAVAQRKPQPQKSPAEADAEPIEVDTGVKPPAKPAAGKKPGGKS